MFRAMPDDEGLPPIDAGEDEGEPELPEEAPNGHTALPAAAGKPAARRGGHKGRMGEVPQTPFKNRDAIQLWPEILARLTALKKSAYELDVRAMIVEPPPWQQVGETFPASSVLGDASRSPGDALSTYILDYVHIPWSRTHGGAPAKYQIQFIWRVNGQLFGRGDIRCPDLKELAAMRQSSYERHNMAPSPHYVPPAAPQQGAPPQGAPPAQQWGYPPAGFGAPAPATDEVTQMREELRRLREENGYQRGVLDEVLRSHREARAAGLAGFGAPPVAAPAPPAAPMTAVDVARIVVETMDARDKAAAAARAGATPPQSLNDVVNTYVNDAGVLVRGIRNLRGLGKTLETVLAEPATDAGAAEVLDGPPDDGLGFQVADVGEDVKWKDGRQVKIAIDKSTGKIDWMGVALANPVVGEKILDSINDLAGGVQKLLRVIGQQQAVGVGQAEVVSETPEDAKDGNPKPEGEGGWGL